MKRGNNFMNTGLLNWRRVLIVAQTLCLVAVAAIFLVSPFVALAGCKGGGEKAKKVDVVPNDEEKKNSLIILGTIPQVIKNAPVQPLNAALTIPGSDPAGAININKKFTIKELANGGLWITGLRNGVMFQGTVFNVKKVNGNQQVAEVWIAEVTKNDKGVKPGQVIKNVSLKGIPAA